MSSTLVGYGSILTAGICFGSFLLPVKKYDTGDGVFFQWILCAGIFLTGLAISLTRGIAMIPHPELAMLAGGLWTTGNLFTVKIIEKLGLGIGMSIWGVVNMFTGWASGFFGILGVKAERVSDPRMNVCGACVALFACIVFSFVQTSPKKSPSTLLNVDDQEELVVKKTDPPGQREIGIDFETSSQGRDIPLENVVNVTGIRRKCDNFHDIEKGNQKLAQPLVSVLSEISTSASSDAPSGRTPSERTPSGRIQNVEDSNVSAVPHVSAQSAVSESEVLCLNSKDLHRTDSTAFETSIIVPSGEVPTKSDSGVSVAESLIGSKEGDSKAKADRIVGFVMCVIAGTLFGVNFNPVFWIQQNVSGASEEVLDYVFYHFTGVFAFSTFYLVCYIVYNKNKPKYVNPEIILPGLVSGIGWAVADTSWFIANSTLGMVVAFPMVATMPGLVASIWGIILYGEVKGRRNFGFLGLAFSLVITSGLLISFSH